MCDEGYGVGVLVLGCEPVHLLRALPERWVVQPFAVFAVCCKSTIDAENRHTMQCADAFGLLVVAHPLPRDPFARLGRLALLGFQCLALFAVELLRRFCG